MDNQNLVYRQLLDKMKAAKPVLENPDELTYHIIQYIKRKKSANKMPQVLRALGAFSGIAASLLIGLFVYETMIRPTPKIEFYSGPAFQLPVTDRLAPDGIDCQNNIGIKAINEIIKHKKAHLTQRKAFYASFINQHKQNRYEYENKNK